jgi:hypothetical protein
MMRASPTPQKTYFYANKHQAYTQSLANVCLSRVEASCRHVRTIASEVLCPLEFSHAHSACRLRCLDTVFLVELVNGLLLSPQRCA